MTTCIVLGSKTQKECLKPIEFVKYISLAITKTSKTLTVDCRESGQPPSRYEAIELICKKYDDTLDLMFAYDYDKRDKGVLYLGYWNDGIV